MTAIVTTVKAVFLTCALALPRNETRRFHLLQQFFNTYRPGYTIVLINTDEYPVPMEEYEFTPFQFEGLNVWLKTSALALPSDLHSDYANYRRTIEKEYPYIRVIFADPKVNLRGKWDDELKKTRYRIGNPPLRVWFIRRRYQESA